MGEDHYLSLVGLLDEAHGHRLAALLVERRHGVIEDNASGVARDRHLGEKERQGQGTLLALAEDGWQVIVGCARAQAQLGERLAELPPWLDVHRYELKLQPP